MGKHAEKRAFVFYFFNNLRNKIKEKGIRVVIAANINEAKQALLDKGEKVLNSKSLGNLQHSGWFCDISYDIEKINDSIIINLPPSY